MRLDPITLILQKNRGCVVMPSLMQSKNKFSKKTDYRLCEFAVLPQRAVRQPFMPDDHSKLAPLLPIPNRTVKRLCADDSAGSRVKVGHRQALTALKNPLGRTDPGGFCLGLGRIGS